MGPGGGAEVGHQDVHPSYETSTALSQPSTAERLQSEDASREQRMATASLEGGLGLSGSSPTAMEMGLMASPFHSEMVQAEIQLRRSRPRTLDADAEALGRGSRESDGVARDPDYSTMMVVPAGQEMRARVARVQAESESQSGVVGMDLGSGVPQAARETVSPLLNGVPGPAAREPTTAEEGLSGGACAIEDVPSRLSGSGTLESLAVRGGSVGPLAITEGESNLESLAEAELAVALVRNGEAKPLPEDSRELVPAASARVEEMLRQVLEENRLLRLRLDQMETQSSWHSGGTRNTHEGAEQSPVSFAAKALVGLCMFPLFAGQQLKVSRKLNVQSMGSRPTNMP